MYNILLSCICIISANGVSCATARTDGGAVRGVPLHGSDVTGRRAGRQLLDIWGRRFLGRSFPCPNS